MKTILSDLRKGKKRRIKHDGVRYLLLPLRAKDVTLSVGDAVWYEDSVHCIRKIKQVNYLPRYFIDEKWVGKNKIRAKAQLLKGEAMSYVDLDFLVGENVFMVCQPETPDFTTKLPAKLLLSGGGKRVEIPLPTDYHKLVELAAKLKHYIGPSYTSQEDKLVLGWNIKGLFSYLLSYTKKDFDIGGRICDLKIMEDYVGVAGDPPGNCAEAMQRITQLANDDSWRQISKHYKVIDYPLISKVLPAIENTPLVHSDLKKNIYACYNLSKHLNGRLSCDDGFAFGFNPHSMSKKHDGIRSKLNLPTNGAYVFALFDYVHMEVAVLQWLSQDPQLGKMIDEGVDLYAGIWEKITKVHCNDEYRQACKAIFLPVVFGGGAGVVAKGLAKTLGKKEENLLESGRRIVNSIYNTFPVALNWVKNQQGLDPTGRVRNYFGRKRQFDQDRSYLARNFVVQSTAATINLHKLIKLHAITDDKAKIIYSIHDGYGMMISKLDLPKYIQKITTTLESDEDYYPGLHLKVACKTGPKLNQMT